MAMQPSASHSLTVRVEIKNQTGMLGKVTSVIGRAGADIGAVDLVGVTPRAVVRDITFAVGDDRGGQAVVDALRRTAGVKLVSVADPTLLMHLGGKLEVRGRVAVKTRDDLRMAYAPGVARVCQAIQQTPDKAYTLTIKQNAVAVVTDGSAVLGLGDVGPRAAMPVMEGTALLLKEFAGVDAFPLALATRDVDEIATIARGIAPAFGGVVLAGIAAPRCFAVEARLGAELDIPVFHDDQHGTAVVVLAALLNALALVKKDLRQVRVVLAGAGPAGIATARLLLAAGVRHLVAWDRSGVLHRGRTANMNPAKQWLAEHTDGRRTTGAAADVLKGADVFVGLSGPGAVTARDLRRMAKDAVVFAMANPAPEVPPEELRGVARVVATGRPDYPNQLTNALCFPGFVRGLLDVRARLVNDDMKLAAARALAALVSRGELGEEHIVPSIFDQRVAETVGVAVARAAIDTGAARKRAAPAPHRRA